MRALNEYRRILLFLRYGIGDLVMELPALKALRTECPLAHITALGTEPALELLTDGSCVDELVGYKLIGYRHWADPGNDQTQARFSHWLRSRDFDLALDRCNAIRGAANAVHLGPDVRDSYSSTAALSLQSGASGVEALRIGVQEGGGVQIPGSAVPVLELRPEEREHADGLLRQFNWPTPRLTALSPVASSRLKQWDPERMARVADVLLDQDQSGRALLFGGPEMQEANSVQSAMRHSSASHVVPALHLRQIAALLERCQLYIGHDTGLSHLAAAVGTPTVLIFGPTSPTLYAPPKPEVRAVGGDDDCPWRIQGAFGPPDCVSQGRCFREELCISKVTVEQVLQSARELYPRADQKGSA